MNLKKHLIILLITLSFSGFAQQIAPFNKIVTFFSDSGIYHERIYSIVSTDSNYYLLMFVSNDSINSHLILVKTDLYGNKLAHKDLASDTSGHYLCYPDNTLLLDKDTNLLVIGLHWSSNEHHGQLIKLNTNLDILWDNVYHIPDSLMGPSCTNGRNSFTAIRQTPDGGYILSGYYFLNCDYSQNVQKLFLQKIDKNGNIEWLKLYPNLSWSFDIELAEDSGYYVPSASSITYSTWIEKMDKYGNQQYQILDVPHMNIAHYDSNTLVVAETFWLNFSLGIRAIKVAKVNIHSKSIVWKKTYRPATNVRYLELYQFINIEVNNGFIYIGGSGELYNQDSSHVGYKGIMMKLNGEGDSLWSRYYGYDSTQFNELSQFYDFCFHSDNEIVAVGYYDLTNPDYTYCQPGWIVKMDSNGMAPLAQTVSVKELKKYNRENEFVLYPNPASDIINIEFDEIPETDIHWQLFDVTGRLLISEETIYQKNITIDVSEFSTGMYLLKINSSAEDNSSVKIIKK